MTTSSMTTSRRRPFWLDATTATILVCALAASAWGGLQGVKFVYRDQFRLITYDLLEDLHTTKEVLPIQLFAGAKLEQSFRSLAPDFCRIEVQTVTWGTTPHPYDCLWALRDLSQPDTPVRQGTFKASECRDWGWLKLDFEPIADSAGKTYRLELSATQDGPEKVGFMLWSNDAVDQTFSARAGENALIPADQGPLRFNMHLSFLR